MLGFLVVVGIVVLLQGCSLPYCGVGLRILGLSPFGLLFVYLLIVGVVFGLLVVVFDLVVAVFVVGVVGSLFLKRRILYGGDFFF